MTTATPGALAVLLVACSSALPPDHPCSEQNPEFLAFLASCKARVELACADIPDDACPVVAECDRAIEERCRE